MQTNNNDQRAETSKKTMNNWLLVVKRVVELSNSVKVSRVSGARATSEQGDGATAQQKSNNHCETVSLSKPERVPSALTHRERKKLLKEKARMDTMAKIRNAVAIAIREAQETEADVKDEKENVRLTQADWSGPSWLTRYKKPTTSRWPLSTLSEKSKGEQNQASEKEDAEATLNEEKIAVGQTITLTGQHEENEEEEDTDDSDQEYSIARYMAYMEENEQWERRKKQASLQQYIFSQMRHYNGQ